MYLFCGSNEREITNWAWRIVFLSNLFGSITSFTLAMSDTLSDLGTLHFVNSILQVVWWICFSLCLLKNPTFVRDGPSTNTLANLNNKINPGKTSGDLNNALSYSSLLDDIGNFTSDEPHPQLCHSCRVVRTLRSKHCKLQRRCIQRVSALILVCVCVYVCVSNVHICMCVCVRVLLCSVCHRLYAGTQMQLVQLLSLTYFLPISPTWPRLLFNSTNNPFIDLSNFNLIYICIAMIPFLVIWPRNLIQNQI